MIIINLSQAIMNSAHQSEIEDILAQYDIGTLIDLERDQRGFVNTSFAITTHYGRQIKKYFLRRYKKGIREEEIQQEHSIIRHVKKQGFDLVADVLSNKSGTTYLQRGIKGEEFFYAIFEFLIGEDRYTWVDPRCTNAEIISSASVLAQFHEAVGDFIPEGKRVEPKIFDLRCDIEENAQECTRRKCENDFDRYWKDHSTLVFREIERIYSLLDKPAYKQLTHLVNHCDYHPGNLKFVGEEVAGLFDFDWSKRDVRIFDVALALFYFFTSWQDELDGELRMDEVRQFIAAYQHTLSGCLSPRLLDELECEFMPAMIAASNLYVLNWTLIDYLTKSIDSVQYLIFLKHSIRMMYWLNSEQSWSLLKRFFEEVSLLDQKS
jgi:homoserine kinase type II